MSEQRQAGSNVLVEYTEHHHYKVTLPASCTVTVRQRVDEPGIWTLEARLGSETVAWRGHEKPTRAEVLNSLMALLKHEISEQIGLTPTTKP